MKRRLYILPLAAFALLTLGGCHPTTKWESVGAVIRKTVLETDEKGVVTQIDLEFEWDPCPGDQFQVVRGGKEFAACVEKYKDGDLFFARVTHWWNPLGYYTWDVTQVGDCKRDVEFVEGSYEKSHECSDVVDYGKKVGFTCSRRPFRKLVQVCPFLARK